MPSAKHEKENQKNELLTLHTLQSRMTCTCSLNLEAQASSPSPCLKELSSYRVVAFGFPLGSRLRPLTQDWLLGGFRKPKVERCQNASGGANSELASPKRRGKVHGKSRPSHGKWLQNGISSRDL